MATPAARQTVNVRLIESVATRIQASDCVQTYTLIVPASRSWPELLTKASKKLGFDVAAVKSVYTCSTEGGAEAQREKTDTDQPIGQIPSGHVVDIVLLTDEEYAAAAVAAGPELFEPAGGEGDAAAVAAPVPAKPRDPQFAAFRGIVGAEADDRTLEHFLGEANGDLERAIDLFFSSGGVAPPPPPGTGDERLFTNIAVRPPLDSEAPAAGIGDDEHEAADAAEQVRSGNGDGCGVLACRGKTGWLAGWLAG